MKTLIRQMMHDTLQRWVAKRAREAGVHHRTISGTKCWLCDRRGVTMTFLTEDDVLLTASVCKEHEPDGLRVYSIP